MNRIWNADWIYLAQEKDKLGGFVNTVMNLRVS